MDEPTSEHSLVTLRRLQQDVLRPALAGLPGVAEVATVGGEVEARLVELKPAELRAAGLAVSDVAATLRARLAGAGPSTDGDIGAWPVVVPGDAPTGAGARPPLIGGLARVRAVGDMASGLVDLDGRGAVVGGIVIARRDADVPALIAHVKDALARARPRLPRGISLQVVYDRSELIARVERTWLGSLAEEIAAVAVVVLLFLLHGRSALLPLVTLPVVVLLTFLGMWIFDVPATVMSIGGIGIALGLAVDADVVALEACHRQLEGEAPAGAGAGARADVNARARVLAAGGAVAPAILTALVIGALAFVPVFAFDGEAGRLLRPLAFTKILVIAAAAVVSLTLAPVLRAGLLRGPLPPEGRNRVVAALVELYRPMVHFVLARPLLTLATAGLAVLSCLPIIPRLGAEFLPHVDEGDLLFMPTTSPNVQMDDAAAQLGLQDQALRARPEVALVFGKLGRAESATDPAPPSMAETTVRLTPRAQWPRVARSRWYSGWAPAALLPALRWLWPEEGPPTTAELVALLDRAARLPGWTNDWTAPARARLDMMSTEVHTPLALRIVAADPERLDRLGAAFRVFAQDLPGTRSAVYESLGAETQVRFVPDRAALARHHADEALVRATADLIIAGGEVGRLAVDGERLRVRLVPDLVPRALEEWLRDATVRAPDGPDGQPVPLGLLGRPEVAVRPASIRTEGGQLYAYVYVDVADGTDLLGYVNDATRALARARAAGRLRLGDDERVEWVGQFRPLVAGQRRLRVIVPFVLLTMLLLLLLQFRSLVEALIVMASVPFALVGSFWTLYLCDYRLSAPVWVGLLSTLGLAMQTGVVMVVYIDEAFFRRVREGRLATRQDIAAAHAEGTIRRLRPKLMTVATMMAGLLPLLWSRGAGAEIMRRIAAPMLGGLVTSAFLTLEVIPVLYTIWRWRQLRAAQRRGVPLEALLGVPPRWARPS